MAREALIHVGGHPTRCHPYEPREVRAEAPPALVDALVVAAIGRLASAPGGRVSLAALRAELAKLSDDAVTIALLDAERRGAITLESAGEAPPADATWWILGGSRGVLAWARVASPA
jgi:hypothetical protein